MARGEQIEVGVTGIARRREYLEAVDGEQNAGLKTLAPVVVGNCAGLEHTVNDQRVQDKVVSPALLTHHDFSQGLALAIVELAQGTQRGSKLHGMGNDRVVAMFQVCAVG